MPIEDKIVEKQFSKFDKDITGWMATHGMFILRVGLGIVFFWFGMLKFFGGLSPAEELIRSTVHFVDPDFFIPFLGAWETVIGVGLIAGRFMRGVLLLLFLHLPGTMLPVLAAPEKVWIRFPFVLTLEGQYIIKNIVLIGSGFVLGATVKSKKRSL